MKRSLKKIAGFLGGAIVESAKPLLLLHQYQRQLNANTSRIIVVACYEYSPEYRS